MRIFSKKIVFALIGIGLTWGCVQETLEGLPAIEHKGNIYALFEPGEKLKLQAGITGYRLDRVSEIDSQRVSAKLFQDGKFIENFNLQSSVRIKLGKTYRLECLIDNQYEVRGTIQLPVDTLNIDNGQVSPLPEPIPVINNTDNEEYELVFAEAFRVTVPGSYPFNQVYISVGQASGLPYFDNDLFVNGERVQVLNRPFTQKFGVRKRKADSKVILYQINADFFQFLRQARNPLMEPETIPGNVSFTNMDHTRPK